MVYSEKFVAVVVSNGKILREARSGQEDVVKLPFGSDYSLRFKNLGTTKACVDVEIDGKDVLDRKRLLVEAGETIDLEGFLDSYRATNAFRFIQKTKEISDYRGDKIDDGFIRITYQFEKQPEVRTQTIIHENHVWKDVYHGPYWYDGPCYGNTKINNVHRTGGVYNDDAGDGATYSCNTKGATADLSADFSRGLEREEKTCGSSIFMNDQNRSSEKMSKCLRSKCSSTPMPQAQAFAHKSEPISEDGITVKGQQVNQQFKYGSVGTLEEKKGVIIIRLKGTNEKQEVVKKAVFVSDKKTCSSCGKRSDSNVKYCPQCGTFLE